MDLVCDATPPGGMMPASITIRPSIDPPSHHLGLTVRAIACLLNLAARSNLEHFENGARHKHHTPSHGDHHQEASSRGGHLRL